MKNFTPEEVEEMRKKGFEPIDAIQKKIVKRPKLFVLYGFHDQTHINIIMQALSETAHAHFLESTEQLVVQNRDNPDKGQILIVPKPLLLSFPPDLLHSVSIGTTSYPIPIISCTPNSCAPKIFRFMDKAYADDFFNNGNLRLSSFSRFAEHENPAMKDADEGRIRLIVTAGSAKLETEVGFGHNSLVLCGTVSATQSFDFNAGFCIENLDGFISAINLELNKTHKLEIYSAIHGPCLYSSNRTLDGTSSVLNADELMQEFGFDTEPPSFNTDTHSAKINNYVGTHGYFLKESSYAHEHEYRILWNIEADSIPPFIDITVPEARKYCKRIK